MKITLDSTNPQDAGLIAYLVANFGDIVKKIQSIEKECEKEGGKSS